MGFRQGRLILADHSIKFGSQSAERAGWERLGGNHRQSGRLSCIGVARNRERIANATVSRLAPRHKSFVEPYIGCCDDLVVRGVPYEKGARQGRRTAKIDAFDGRTVEVGLAALRRTPGKVYVLAAAGT